ncbi:hypothetical protein GCM10009087_25540 [Sphingomonas oligophenolica]|uniref:Uncharacterized protein n=1 Tax=Sphingomonas oligophenolica TaxID=301154 RepID=A0ABU9Y894_9SPHN
MSADEDKGAPAPILKTGIWYQAGSYRVRSLVPNVSIAPSLDLPVVAYKKYESDFCGSEGPIRETPEGRWARSRGWRVDDQGTFGPLTVVSVLRRYDYQAQFCGQVDGRIILFDHGKPIASVHVGDADDEGQVDGLGVRANGALRLTNMWFKPFGDLFVEGRDIEVRPLPRSDSICDGAATLPNVFGKPIAQARSILGRSGWKADPQPPPVVTKNPDGSLEFENSDDYNMYNRGFKEEKNCDPRGFCEFHYKRGEIKVMLYTQGEEVVQHYEECQTK